jgi:aspartyl protease
MPVIVEPFKPIFHVDKVTKRFDLTYLPKVTIMVKVEGQLYPFPIEAFVDSGATRNLFPADTLKALNIPLDNGKKKIHYGIGGIEVTSYIHQAEIIIGADRYAIKTDIDFSSNHKPPLLGMAKFFDFFDSVNFNMERSQLELRYGTKKN